MGWLFQQFKIWGTPKPSVSISPYSFEGAPRLHILTNAHYPAPIYFNEPINYINQCRYLILGHTYKFRKMESLNELLDQLPNCLHHISPIGLSWDVMILWHARDMS